MQHYISWIIDQALPTWAVDGFDGNADRFVERLDTSGRPIDVPHRAMVQARQIYVYAHAAALGWYPEGAALAERGMAALRRDFCETYGGRASLAFSIDPGSGRVVSDARDAYTHAFVLFAIAQLHMLNGDSALIDLAERITRYVDGHMLDASYGGVCDVAPQSAAPKRQNPQMHLLEAYLWLEKTAPGRGYLERADTLVHLFHHRLTHRHHGVVLEHFAADWTTHPDAERATVFEPGHHYEWSWLLHQHGMLAGADHGVWQNRLFETAIRYGLSAEGLVYDEIAADKTIVKSSHRLWPHTEAIKAAAVRHRSGDLKAQAFASSMADILLAHFLGRPFSGGWTDQLTADRQTMVDYVPASSLYHLFLAASEADMMSSTIRSSPILAASS